MCEGAEVHSSSCERESRALLLRLELVLPKELPKVSEPLSSGSAATLLARGPVVGQKLEGRESVHATIDCVRTILPE